MVEHVADGDPFRHSRGVEKVEPGRHRLQHAQARRSRKPGAPDMPDHDFRIRQQRGKMGHMALIVEDRRFQRRFDLSKNSRRDGSGKMAEKQSFHPLSSLMNVRSNSALSCRALTTGD